MQAKRTSGEAAALRARLEKRDSLLMVDLPRLERMLPDIDAEPARLGAAAGATRARASLSRRAPLADARLTLLPFFPLA